MSNSPLVNHTRISANRNSPRRDKIRKITIHHVAGNLTVERLGDLFAPSTRKASSNYGIGTDGRVGMYVEEKDRAWTSSSADNDHQAITIEVANNGGAPNWPVSDTALRKLIDLCVDICKRNGIVSLNYTGEAKGNLTRHNMFAATACPGPYLQSKFPYIVTEVNKRLLAPPIGGEYISLREIAVDVDGKRTDESGYLINQSTYIKASYLVNLIGGTVTGHGDHIKITLPSKVDPAELMKIEAQLDKEKADHTITKNNLAKAQDKINKGLVSAKRAVTELS